MTTYALLHTIFFFFVYAFLGWCVEVAYAAITTRELVNRGFLNGPICPIYGCGMTVMIAVLGRFTMPSSDMAWYQNVLVAFFGGMVITTLVELVGGYILYKMFHTRWWDYSMYRFNLGGFICPQFSLLWGLGSVLLMVVVHPLLSKPSAAIPTLVLIWLDVIFGGLFLADLIVSAIQAVGFSKQLARIDELRKAMRTTSDALTEVIGTSAMTMDTLLDEQKLQLTLAAMVAAAYAVLSLLGAVFGITYGPIQVRFSEALCLLPFLFPETAWGLGVGCLIANLFSPYGALDIVVGSLSTLIAALLTARCRSPWTAALPPVVCNMVLVGAVLAYETAGTSAAFWPAYGLNALTVGLGEAIACLVLGVLLVKQLPKIPYFRNRLAS